VVAQPYEEQRKAEREEERGGADLRDVDQLPGREQRAEDDQEDAEKRDRARPPDTSVANPRPSMRTALGD